MCPGLVLLPADESQVPHSTSAGGLPPLGLHRPAEAPDLGGGESAGVTDLLLDVECHLAAPPTQSVGLVASLSKGTSSLSHDGGLLLLK